MDKSTMYRMVRQHYLFEIDEVIHNGSEYLLQTNWGPKLAIVLEDRVLLHHSFLWREDLVKKGLRLTDRFIRTRDGAPFCPFQDQYIVLRDQLEQESLTYSESLAEDIYLATGQVLGIMYRSVKELNERYKYHKEFSDWKCKQISLQSVYSTEHMLKLKEAIYSRTESLFLTLVRSNWKQLEKRWKDASLLLRQYSISFVAPFMPELHSFYLYQEKWLAYASKRIRSSIGLQGLSFVLQEIFERGNGNFFKLEQLLSGIAESYDLTIAEHFEILAWLIYPQEFFVLIEQYLKQNTEEEESISHWMELCQKQERYDQLQLWYAQKTDRLREEAVSL
ncbi:hypothetical protein [Bacillus horti]|uniref:Spore coat protein n=1 Tax=Caldalkalibacillus horti TaxID=77523 RepID=A0ABT9VTJ1_9BACI|nr:hypothetical protein [Bacillus horti]MDQ0164301.1 hypothetical protein [Bacillus horti]